ncbi:Pyruvate carboxylase, mitochondrial [Gossypium arboreum]|uniref:Pyruvate carboxylase, mitochondrial n=1 Tax=Gossypium arboreum TaxID=29729 RepID=A0A0B0MVY5_GOSAR|nr:Pyruvate carboxylase, mitochondrial [Gossypium arboreum]
MHVTEMSSLAYISRMMHVPDMSYTSSHFNVDAMSQTWSYTGSRLNFAILDL